VDSLKVLDLKWPIREADIPIAQHGMAQVSHFGHPFPGLAPCDQIATALENHVYSAAILSGLPSAPGYKLPRIN
jgi:hypothetical protein